VSEDLKSVDYDRGRLQFWLENLYKQRGLVLKNPKEWHPSVVAHYDMYKAKGERLADAHEAYLSTRRQFKSLVGSMSNLTEQHHVLLSDRAIVWGEAAVVYVNTKFSSWLPCSILANRIILAPLVLEKISSCLGAVPMTMNSMMKLQKSSTAI
jgi:hypothetical protein